MDTIVIFIFVIIGMICGGMLGVGIVMKNVVTSNDIGDYEGKACDFKVYGSEHILVQEDKHRVLGMSKDNYKL